MAEPTPLVCPACGTPPVPGARFCYACGTALDPALLAADTAAERRIVTVVFGDLSDFTAWAEDLDPERVGVVTDRVLAALSKATTDMGGRVDKLTGDGVMAVFGAPTAHEDDAERAVRAAARMQSEVRRLMEEESGGGRRMGLRVGINTGEVLAGVQAHLTYTVVGDTVNTASRLSDAAGVGSVYAGRETALATMSIASWRALTPLRLKGKREPVPAYELVGLRPPGAVRVGLGDEAPFIGRDAEFGWLVGKLLDVVDSGRAASVVITGEAGVGKTRLAVELTRFAGEVPATRVLWGRCTPFGESRELAPLAEWMRTAFGITEGDDALTAESRARRTLARLAQPNVERPLTAATTDRLLGLLGLVEWAPLGPRDAAAPGTSAASTDPFVDAVSAVIDALARTGPLLLVVDDAQWAGTSLLAALEQLTSQALGAVLLVVIGRSDVLGRDWAEYLPDVEALPVTPLDDAASERLLRAYLGGADLEPEVRDVLLGRAQGNPFFLAELLHLLVDRGLLARMGDGWRLTGEIPRDVLPAGVQAVLAARIDTLDPPARAVLRDAAVAGSRVTAGMLRALEPATDEDSIDAGLSELVSRGILRPVGDASDTGAVPSYVFVHALARDVAYAGIAKADRAHRHAALALWAVGSLTWSAGEVDVLVATQAEQAVALASEMALSANDPAWSARAAGFAALRRLGEAALARDDNHRADALLGRALAIGADAIDDGARIDALTGRAAARVALNRLDDAEADLDLPRTSTDLRRRASALVVLGDILRRRGQADEATRVLVSALASASDAGVDRVTGEALRQLGMIDYRSGRLAAAEGRFREALALAERVGDRRGAGWALQHLAWSATTRGDYAVAERVLAAAADVFTGLNDDGGLSWCAGTEAFIRLLQGRFREARELARGLLSIGAALGDEWGSAACLSIDAYAAAELGQVGDAVAQASAAYDVFVRLGDTWGQAMTLVARGAARRGEGRTKEAGDDLRRAVALSRDAHHAVTEALALTSLGYVRLDANDGKSALDTAKQALAVLGELDLEPSALIGPKVLMAQALRSRGELEPALELLREAEQCRDPSLIFPRRQALAHLAGALLESGDVSGALRTVHEAFAAPAEDVRSRTVALRVLAQCLAAAGDASGAAAAGRQAVALSASTPMGSERAASARTYKSVTSS